MEFHKAFGLPISASPTLSLPPELIALRDALLGEEYRELKAAIDARDVIGVADALGDMVYVLFGTALTFGIPLDQVVKEIHHSNMSKLNIDGRPMLRADGKVLKGSNYQPPDIVGLLSTAEERSAVPTAAVAPCDSPTGSHRAS